MTEGHIKDWYKFHIPVMKAWIEGKQIQVKSMPRGTDWVDCVPTWSMDMEYRVKPEPVRIWVVLVGSAIHGTYGNKEDAQKRALHAQPYYESLNVRVVEMVEVV